MNLRRVTVPALNSRIHPLPSYDSSGLLALIGGEYSGLGFCYERWGNNWVHFRECFSGRQSQQVLVSANRNRRYGYSTDDVPMSTVMFFSVVVSATGSDSVENFIYGGHNGSWIETVPEPDPSSSDDEAQAAFDPV